MIKPSRVWAISLALATTPHVQAHQQDQGFEGDLGVMLTHRASTITALGSQSQALPYVYGDWGRFYGRVDTFGVRTLPWGSGHLELAARIGTEGFEGRKMGYAALGERSAPLPVGLGTFQRTPLGGVFAYLMHDSRSGGAFAELNWAGRLPMGDGTLYPQLGMQYRSQAYVNHLYGVSAIQAAATGLARYQGGDSLVPMATLHVSHPLGHGWSVQLQLRRRWLDAAIHRSPLVGQHTEDSGLLALTRSLP